MTSRIAVDGLVAADSRGWRRPGSPRVSRVDHHLHQALRLTLFDGASDSGHRPLADQQPGAPARADLGLRSCPRVPAADRCRARRSGSGRSPAAGSSSSRLAATISKSLYDVCVNAPLPLQSPSAQMWATLVCELVVDDDVAARVGPRRRPRRGRGRRCWDADRPPAARASPPPVGRAGTRRRRSTPRSCALRLMHFAPTTHVDAFVLAGSSSMASETSSSSRDISRGPISTTVTARAEAPVHLRELQPDVAAAHDDEMLWQPCPARGSSCWCRYGDVGRSRADVRHHGAPADVEEDALARSTSSPTRTCVRIRSAACPRRTVQPGMARSQLSTPCASIEHDARLCAP